MKILCRLFLSIFLNSLPLAVSWTNGATGQRSAPCSRTGVVPARVRRRHCLSTRRVIASSSSVHDDPSENCGPIEQPSYWRSVVSVQSDIAEAVDELVEGIAGTGENDKDQLTPPDLAFLFVSQFHGSNFPRVVQALHKRLQCRLLSVVGSGVIGQNQEMEEPSKPSMSLLVGYRVTTTTKDDDAMEVFDFNELQKPPPEPSSAYWDLFANPSNLSRDRNEKDVDNPNPPCSVICLADPWSPVEQVTAALPLGTVVAGGISCPTGTGPTVALDDRPLPQGSLVGVRLPRRLRLHVVTAQGCRPLHSATPFVITAAEGSVILELDGQPALQVMEGVVQSATAPLTGVVCGIQAKEESPEASHDYLIRQIVGFVPARGGLAVPGGVHVGDRLCFHVRDKEAARQDLALMLQRAQTERSVFGEKGQWVGALQFSCVARGRSFFGERNVDLDQTKSLLPEGSPVAGFYANGELGPVGIAGFAKAGSATRGSHIHGFTTVVAYLCDTMGVTASRELEPVLSPIADDPSAWE